MDSIDGLFTRLRYSDIEAFVNTNQRINDSGYLPIQSEVENMETKKIVLWSQDDLLSSSVELFLTAQKGWHVLKISQGENFETLILEVEKVHPDVVIIQQGNHASKSYPLMKLIQDHPKLRVITVSLRNNVMEVYSKQNVLIESASDFISVVNALTKHVDPALEINRTNS